MSVNIQLSNRVHFALAICVVWVLGIGIWMVWAVRSGGCANEFGYEQASPDGEWKAVVFERNCGATTGFSTQISILPNSQRLPNEAGNIFAAKGDLALGIEWKSNHELLISYPAGTEIHRKEDRKGSVAISYK